MSERYVNIPASFTWIVGFDGTLAWKFFTQEAKSFADRVSVPAEDLALSM